MRRIVSFVFIFLALVAFSPQQIREDVYVMQGRLNWKLSFAEPFEIIFLLLYDTRLIGLTTQDEHAVDVSVSFIEEFLEADGYGISDIAIVLHNHFRSSFFSWGNGLVLKELRRRGFKGSFGVYHTPTDKITWAERDGN